MIRDLDMILTDTGAVALLVPGALPLETLTLEVSGRDVCLRGGAALLARVEDIEESALALLAGCEEVGLIEITDPARPPVAITHTARVVDRREGMPS